MKKVIFITLFIVMFSSLVYAGEPSNWAEKEIKMAIENQLVTDELMGEYKGQATREEFVKLIILTYEKMINKEIGISDYENPFTDTENEYAIKAHLKGFVNGKGDGRFAGSDFVSREEMIVILVRMNKVLEEELGVKIFDLEGANEDFSDYESVADWARESVKLASSSQIVTGYTDGTIRPKNLITKEQVLVLNLRAFNNIQLKIAGPEDKKGYVTCSVLNFRSSAEMVDKENIIGKLYRYEHVTIKDKIDDWYKVVSQTGLEGYVHSDFIDLLDIRPNTGNLSPVREELVAFAMQHMDLPYVYGGNSLTTGTDCSGFVQLIYKNFGYSLNRTASGQAKNGIYVPKENLLPGDLVIYGRNGVIQHIAIYIGDGKVIHEGTSSTGVLITDVFSSWNKPYITSRRIIND